MERLLLTASQRTLPAAAAVVLTSASFAAAHLHGVPNGPIGVGMVLLWGLALSFLRSRKAVRVRGHFPTEQAALKCVYVAVMSLDPSSQWRACWTQGWKIALNTFDIAFNGRLPVGR